MVQLARFFTDVFDVPDIIKVTTSTEMKQWIFFWARQLAVLPEVTAHPQQSATAGTAASSTNAKEKPRRSALRQTNTANSRRTNVSLLPEWALWFPSHIWVFLVHIFGRGHLRTPCCRRSPLQLRQAGSPLRRVLRTDGQRSIRSRVLRHQRNLAIGSISLNGSSWCPEHKGFNFPC